MAPPPPWPPQDQENAGASAHNTARASMRPTKLDFNTPRRLPPASPAKTPRAAKRAANASITAAHYARPPAGGRATPRAPPSTPAPAAALARVAPAKAAVIAATPRARVEAAPAYRAVGTRVESRDMWRELNRRNLAAWANFVLVARVGGVEGLEGAAAKKVLAGMRAAAERADVKGALGKVRADIGARRLYVDRAVNLRVNPVARAALVRLLLLTYEPAWLLPCLALVLQDTRCMDLSALPRDRTDRDVMEHIERLLASRLLGSELDVHAYTRAMADVIPNPADIPREVFNAAVLDAVLTVVIVLDVAKSSAAGAPTTLLDVDNDPPLFRHDSAHKRSEDVLAALGREFLRDHGSIKRYLGYKGYKLTYTAPAYESGTGGHLFVERLDTDFKDGVRLCKLASLLARDPAMLHSVVAVSDPALTSVTTADATENNCIQNLRLALRSLNASSERSANYRQQDKFDWAAQTRSLARGDFDATVDILWRVAWLWVGERVIGQYSAVQTETDRLHREFRAERKKALDDRPVHRRSILQSHVLETSPSDARDLEAHCVGSGSHELLSWVTAVGMFYGKIVREWTESFRDGSMLCLLIHHYYPDVMPLEDVTNVPLAEMRASSQAQMDEGEYARRNFEQFTAFAASLGGIPHMLISVAAAHAPGFTSDHKPLTFGRQMQLLASYLFARCVTFKPVSDEDEHIFNLLEQRSLATPKRNSLQLAEMESQRRLSALARRVQQNAMKNAAEQSARARMHGAPAASSSPASEEAAAVDSGVLSSPEFGAGSDVGADEDRQCPMPSEGGHVADGGECADGGCVSRLGNRKRAAARRIQRAVLRWWLGREDRQRYLELLGAVDTCRLYRRAAQAQRILGFWHAAAAVVQRAWRGREARQLIAARNRLRPLVHGHVVSRDLTALAALSRSRQSRLVARICQLDAAPAIALDIERDGAAIVVQKHFRGYFARQNERIRREEMELERQRKIVEEEAEARRGREGRRTAELELRQENQAGLDLCAAASLAARAVWQAACCKFTSSERVYEAFIAGCVKSDAADRDLDQRLHASLEREMAMRAMDERRDVERSRSADLQFAAFDEHVQRMAMEQGRLDDSRREFANQMQSVQASVDEARQERAEEGEASSRAHERHVAALRQLAEREAEVHRLCVENEKFAKDAAEQFERRLQQAAAFTEAQSRLLDAAADQSLRQRKRLEALEAAFAAASEAVHHATGEAAALEESQAEELCNLESAREGARLAAEDGDGDSVDVLVAAVRAAEEADLRASVSTDADARAVADLLSEADALVGDMDSARDAEIEADAQEEAADHLLAEAHAKEMAALAAYQTAALAYQAREAQIDGLIQLEEAARVVAAADLAAKAKAKAENESRVAAELAAQAKAEEEARVAAELAAKERAEHEARVAAERAAKERAEEVRVAGELGVKAETDARAAAEELALAKPAKLATARRGQGAKYITGSVAAPEVFATASDARLTGIVTGEPSWTAGDDVELHTGKQRGVGPGAAQPVLRDGRAGVERTTASTFGPIARDEAASPHSRSASECLTSSSPGQLSDVRPGQGSNDWTADALAMMNLMERDDGMGSCEPVLGGAAGTGSSGAPEFGVVAVTAEARVVVESTGHMEAGGEAQFISDHARETSRSPSARSSADAAVARRVAPDRHDALDLQSPVAFSSAAVAALPSASTTFASVLEQRASTNLGRGTPTRFGARRATVLSAQAAAAPEGEVAPEVVDAAAVLCSIPSIPDSLLSPELYHAIRSLSTGSRSPANSGYISTPDILRMVLTMLRSCRSEKRDQAAVTKSGLVELALNVLQNVCSHDAGAQVLFDVEDSVEVITTLLQFSRYKSSIFSRAVAIMHCLCCDDSRLQAIRRDRGIVARLSAVHKVQARSMETFAKHMDRLRRTEALLLQLDGAGDMAPEIPRATLPDDHAFNQLSDICSMMRGEDAA